MAEAAQPSGEALDRSELRRRSASGLAVSFGSQIVRFAAQFGVSVTLARLLVPEDFGILAMGGPLLALLYLFSDLGLTQATIQRPTLTQRQLSIIFWMSLSVSVVAGLIVIGLSPLAATFYREPRLTKVLIALGFVMMTSGLFTQHMALLNRELRFTALVVIDLAAFFVSSGVAIAAAFAGLSYWALVLGQAVNSIMMLVLSWSLTRWIPSSPRGAENKRELIGFGGNVTTFNLVNFFARNADNVLIGRVLGEVQLGLYDRAYKLLLLPLSQINGPMARVATPLLSRLMGQPDHYRKSYRLMLETILLVTYPGVLATGLASSLVIGTVLGPQWLAAAPVFQVLAIGGLFAPIGNSTGWLFTTQNRTGEMRNCGIASSIAFVASFIVGLPWGIQGVATSYIAVGCVQGPLIWWAATSKGPIRFKELLGWLLPYAIAAIVAAAAVLLVLLHLKAGWMSIIILLGVSYAAFLPVVLLFPGARQTVGMIVGEGLRLVSAKAGRNSPGLA